MKTSYKILSEEGIYFITSTIVDWIPIFNSEKYYNILVDTINFYRVRDNLKIYAYVFLNNHFHLIASHKNLSKIIQSVKKYSAKEIIQYLKEDNKTDILDKLKELKPDYKNKSNYQVWQEGFHPKEIPTLNVLNQKIEYIHLNPVRKGLTIEPQEWRYSSAREFLTRKNGPIKIDIFKLYETGVS